MLYAADSESGSVAPAHGAWTRGIRIGSVRDGKDGKVQFFIPDPNPKATNTSAAEGVAVDAAGNIYGAEVGPEGAEEIRQEIEDEIKLQVKGHRSKVRNVLTRAIFSGKTGAPARA